MTMAPSAATGNLASSGPRTYRTASTDPAATSEYTWVRLPVATAMAVLLALLLTGNPRSRLTPALATPSARNSWFARTLSLRRANERAVSTSSVKATIITVTAGSSSSRSSCQCTSGSWGTGSLPGTGPTTATPWPASPNTATAPVASSMASNGPGACGQRHRTTKRNISTALARATVTGCHAPKPLAKDISSATNVLPLTGTPVTRPS